MELDEVPEHLIILGGGYIGLEFGQMFRRFGSEVTIIQRAARLLKARTRTSPTRSPHPARGRHRGPDLVDAGPR